MIWGLSSVCVFHYHSMCILPKAECWVEQDCSLVKGTGVSYAPYKNLKASSQIQKRLNLEILNTGCDCQLIIDVIKSPLQSTEERKGFSTWPAGPTDLGSLAGQGMIVERHGGAKLLTSWLLMVTGAQGNGDLERRGLGTNITFNFIPQWPNLLSLAFISWRFHKFSVVPSSDCL